MKYYIVPLRGNNQSGTKANLTRGARLFKKHVDSIILIPTGRMSSRRDNSIENRKITLISLGVPEKNILLPEDYAKNDRDAKSAFSLRGQIHAIQRNVSKQEWKNSTESFHIAVACLWQQYLRAKFLWWIHSDKNIKVTFHISLKFGNPFNFLTECISLSKEGLIFLREVIFRHNFVNCKYCGRKEVRLPLISMEDRLKKRITPGFTKCCYCNGDRMEIFENPNVAA